MSSHRLRLLKSANTERGQKKGAEARRSTVVFYGRRFFRCNPLQSCATITDGNAEGKCVCDTSRNAVQNSEKRLPSIRNPMLYPAELWALNAVSGEYCRSGLA